MYEAHFVPRGQPGCHARLPRRRSIPGWRRTSCSAERLGPGRLEADEGGRLRRTRNQDQGRIGAFRIIYLAALADRILVLHAFQKKTQQTAQRDIELAAKRLKDWKAQQ